MLPKKRGRPAKRKPDAEDAPEDPVPAQRTRGRQRKGDLASNSVGTTSVTDLHMQVPSTGVRRSKRTRLARASMDATPSEFAPMDLDAAEIADAVSPDNASEVITIPPSAERSSPAADKSPESAALPYQPQNDLPHFDDHTPIPIDPILLPGNVLSVQQDVSSMIVSRKTSQYIR